MNNTNPNKDKEREMNDANPNKDKKWTKWSVVSTGDGGGEYRCKRSNVEDANDTQYQEVPRPTFNKRELTALVNFGQTHLLPTEDLVGSAYDVRYRTLAFRLCSELNAQPSGAK